ncbi:unnamed protein product [Colias eurytheme]|nr:unnamed protein product [Colias eurytheme]
MSTISSWKIAAILLNLLTICTYGDPGTLRTIEMQNLPMENERHMASFPNTIYYPNMYSVPYEQSNLMQAKSAPRTESQESKSSTTFNDFVDAVNDLTDNDEYPQHPQSRVASKFVTPITFNKPLKYTFDKPNYVPWSPNIYQDTPNVLGPPAIHTDKLWKPRFGLFDSGSPNKLGGLLNLGLALLGGSDLKGLKDTFIHSILKPLFVAKSSLKAIISKLAVPVLALVLVNVEILFVVWWMWEDCPEVKPAESTTPYSQTTSSNFSTSK